MDHLFGDALIAEAGITALHFEDRVDQLGRRAFRTGFPAVLGCKKQATFPYNQCAMKTHDRGGLKNNGRPQESGRADH